MPKEYNFLRKIPSDITELDYHHKKNVVKTAAKIIQKLIKFDEIVVVAEMQSGKTEIMKRLIYIINKYNDKIKNLGIDIDQNNINIILCTSSINLKNQLKEKLCEINYKIYHLNNINIFIKNPYEFDSLFARMADNSLIIFDECHCDIECQKVIDKFRSIIKKISKRNKTKYYKIGFSATPYTQIIAKYPKVIMKPGPNYYGLEEMFNSAVPVVFQAKNLIDTTECEKLFTEIEILNFYYIFRLPRIKSMEDLVICNIENQFKKNQFNIDSYIYDMSYKSNINDLLEIQPKKPTIIYLKNKLRMGEYLNTEYVYMVHDDPFNQYTHTTIQSLIGRCCGYNKKNHHIIIYCDYEKAWQHYEWIKNKFSIDYIPRDAKYIRKDDGSVIDNCIY